ncbi:hypothetical protein Avbf_05185 [Armadillidium vulgare]|nr:hypothetical protein Avbf_05185 [Armadillidium vulgare]
MIRGCRNYISCRGSETIWSQQEENVRAKIQSCLELNKAYRTAYQKTKNKLNSMENERPFSFSEQYVFGKFDAFCVRLRKILSLFDDIQKFSNFFEGRVEYR